MSKGLEALDRLINEVEKDSRTASFLFHDTVSWDEDKELVKEELEDLETIKEIFSDYGLEYKLTLVREALLLLKQYQGSYGVRGQALITKKLKALEIIKNHIGVIKGYIYTTDSQITDSEYELLCEVLR